MTDLPAPPVPAGADLKDFAFTPMYRARLFGSAFHARANDAEWRAGVTLWLKSQDQVPAGSLPDDDIELCRLAELGRDLKTWRKVRPGALHGWYKCGDGRLYHDVVAEVVNEQWQGKIDQRLRTLKARIAALEKRLSQATELQAKVDIETQLHNLRHELSQTAKRPVAASVTEPVTASKGEGEGERKGQGQGDSSSKPMTTERTPDIVIVAAFTELRERYWPKWPNFPADGGVLRDEAKQWLAAGGTPELCIDVMDRAMQKKRAKATDNGAPGSLMFCKFTMAQAIKRNAQTEAITAAATAPIGPSNPLTPEQDRAWMADLARWERLPASERANLPRPQPQDYLPGGKGSPFKADPAPAVRSARTVEPASPAIGDDLLEIPDFLRRDAGGTPA